ncbi:hypothetical protein FQN55_003277 [Onygenales sp. PD_40]|nr:hypothetical protein FQN55_003277 [Onygenales sp. PD_40]KAK2794481.1 hypothetical protein FQN52_008059 [Onygenales sp. PD_12]
MASRFPPRERSPHRYNDRRPSAAHSSSHIPSGPRASDDANSTPLGREPPRGPKALIDPSRGAPYAPPGPRGRGFSARADFRDRERDRDIRDSRDGPPFRRDLDREWPRRERGFDSRDSRVPFGGRRSRSPPLRDFRDTREPGPRDLDAPRLRRNSRDGPIGSMNSVPDASPLRGIPMRGRGRGDRERGRGRGAFLDDRDSFRRRSRSRDAWRDRERDRDRDFERVDRFDRREDDRRSERDERERNSDRPDLFRKDRLPPRLEPKHTSLAPTNTLSAPLTTPSTIPSVDKGVGLEPNELNRKSLLPQQVIRDTRQDSDKPEPPPIQLDVPKVRTIPQQSPPPSAPEVPAFGAFKSPNRAAAETPASLPLAAKPSGPEEPPSSSSTITKSEKDHGEDTIPTTILPPTGPKADRPDADRPLDSRISRPPPPDSRSKIEASFRAGRNFSSSSHSPTAPGQDIPVLHAPPSGPRDLHMSQQSEPNPQESQLAVRPVARPSSSSGSPPSQPLGRSMSISRRSGSPPAPPPAPFRSPVSKTSPRLPFSSVPTGPRALQRPTAPRGTPKASNQWVRPGYANRGPSIMNSAPAAKRDLFDDKDKALPSGHDVSNNRRIDSASQQDDSKSSPVATRAPPQADVSDESTDVLGVKSPGEVQEQPATASSVTEPVATPLIFDQSSGEESDEENDLDEEDFNEGEKRFEKEMQALATEIPPPTLQDPIIIDLLLKIQMLGIIAEGVVPTYLDLPGAAMEVEKPDQPPAVIPLSSKEAQEIELPEPSSPRTNAENTTAALEIPTVENLPFLQSGPPTPFSDLEAYQETLQTHNRVKEALRGELIKQRKDIARQHEKLRQQYAGYYKPWRIVVDELDRKNTLEKTATPGPPTPPSAVLAVTTPGGAQEGRRGYKLNSELDFQNALIASAITAKEEQERRRDKEGSAKPDMSKEALIPDMFEVQEKEALVFKDTNNVVNPADAFDVFAFYPVPDNFTPEEQKIFTEAFLAHPKKWGKIAESLPGRNFQDCINHYYFTKEEFKYKAKLNKKYVRRRGKKTAAARNPKSNALMADLGVRPLYDGDDAETPAVTDTGRPRRAAAPTFGEVGPDTDNSTPTPSSGRRTNNAKDNGEQPPEKPVSRRGGRGGGRGGRRAKAQLAAAATPIAAAPPKPEPEVPVETTPALVAVKEKEELKDGTTEDMAPRMKAAKARTKEVMYAFDSLEPEAPPPKLAEGRPASLQPTSYWSVPEQREFPDLICHFGKDFDSISQYMRTKTPTMVKNYFQRRVDSGQTQLEEMAERAEAKKLSGESTGPLPVPNIPQKRRYEATPSSVAPRPLAPNTEVAEPIDATMSSKPKAAAVPLSAAQPAPTQARQQVEKERSQPRFYPLAQATNSPVTNLQPMNEEAQQRSIRPQLPHAQRSQQGPRAGYFSDERRDGRTGLPISPLTTLASQEPSGPKMQQNVIPIQGSARLGGLHSQNLTRHEMHMQSQEGQETMRYPSMSQTVAFPQTSYLQQQQQQTNSPVTPASRTHSRRSSRAVTTSTATSPIQRLPKQDPDAASMLRNEQLVQPKSSMPLPGQLLGIGRRSPVISPTKETARPSSTPAQGHPEPPRHVPAKRSNIINILNDDPEEPPPRKRFASDQPSPANTSQLYPGPHSKSQPGHPASHDEPLHAARSHQQPRPQYLHPSQAQAQTQQVQTPQPQPPTGPSRSSYSEYSSYSVGSSGTTNEEWMARMDPRQQQSQASATSDHSLSRLSAQQPVSLGYSSHQPTNPGAGVQHQTQQQQPSRPSYSHQSLQQPQQSQPTSFQGQPQHQPSHVNLGSRESPMSLQSQVYHPASPQHRQSTLSYSRRTPQQQPASPVQMPSSGLPQTQQLPSYSQGPSHQGPSQQRHHSTPTSQLGHSQHLSQGGSSSQHMQHMAAPPSPHHHHAQIHHQHQQQQSRQAQHQHHQQQQHQHQHSHQPQHIPSLGMTSQQGGSPFSHNAPPPSHLPPVHRAASASLSGPSSHPSSSIGRPFTPPAVLHQHSQGGMSYPSGGVPPQPPHGSQQQGLHQMHPHQLHPRRSTGQSHHRTYSQDSRQ